MSIDGDLQHAIAVIRRSGESLEVVKELLGSLSTDEKRVIHNLLPVFAHPSARAQPRELLPQGYTEIPSIETLNAAGWEEEYDPSNLSEFALTLRFYWRTQLRLFTRRFDVRELTSNRHIDPITAASHQLRHELLRESRRERPIPLPGPAPRPFNPVPDRFEGCGAGNCACGSCV